MSSTFASVGGPVNTIADGDAVARPSLARAYPDILRIRGIDRDRPDRLYRLFVEDGFESGATVTGFPHAAAGGADEQIDLSGVVAEAGERAKSARSLPPSRCCGAPRPEMLDELNGASAA